MSLINLNPKSAVRNRGDLLRSIIAGDGSKQEAKITAPIFAHKRGNRASIFAASLTHSRGRRNSGASLSITSFSHFLASMFHMQERSAKDVESMCVMKGSMQMLKKRSNNSWIQVHCIMDLQANLYIFETKDSQRSIQICPLMYAKIVDCCEVTLSQPLCIEVSFEGTESKNFPGCTLKAESLKNKHEWLTTMRYHQHSASTPSVQSTGSQARTASAPSSIGDLNRKNSDKGGEMESLLQQENVQANSDTVNDASR